VCVFIVDKISFFCLPFVDSVMVHGMCWLLDL